MHVKEAVKRFLEYCELDKNLSQKTVRMYGYYLHFFADWVEKKYTPDFPDITRIDDNIVREFRLHLGRTYRNPYKGNLQAQTQNYFLVAIRSMFRYLIKTKHKVLSPEMIELGKRRDRIVKFLSPDELQRLFAAVDTVDEAGLRDAAILQVLFSTGLRVSELAQLNRDQVNTQTGEFGVIGKGGKGRVVFLSKQAKKAIHTYLNARTDAYRPLFLRYSGPKEEETLTDERRRLSVRSIERMIEKYRKKAGILFRIGPHVLRHSYATDLLSHGADIRSVQEMLGHKNIATTQIYTHVTNTQLRQVHERFHSGNQSAETPV